MIDHRASAPTATARAALTYPLEIDVTSAEGIPQRTLAQTIKETVRQIGARVVAEETD